MKNTKNVVKDTFSKNNSEQDEELHQALKVENKERLNRLKQLEEKLDELISSEADSGKIEKIKHDGSTDIKKSVEYTTEPVLLKSEYNPALQRLSIFGILKIKLIKWTLLTVGIPQLNIDFKRMD